MTNYAFSRWDEWVPSPRLLKFNETNLALQKSLQANAAGSVAAHSAATKVKGSTTGTRDMKSGVSSLMGRKEGGRGVKRQREEVRVLSLLFSIVMFSKYH